MYRKKFIEDLLKTINAEDGDRILIENKKMKKEGVLMPHHQFSDEDIITIKLDNGYNIGFAVDNDTKITLLEKHKVIEKKSKTIPSEALKEERVTTIPKGSTPQAIGGGSAEHPTGMMI